VTPLRAAAGLRARAERWVQKGRRYWSRRRPLDIAIDGTL
jgi:hypothetical protein